ncbi:hypothetical protein MMCCUG48898_4559 [Mycobacteroides abscessus subsp. massiliense CCUG 48898 = JCM 15300]|nr:hypothetical protein MMCCUG48898_4559 [Mycobacteroides abscessus subsp. massiliense CCUG 48898 = JCM 15300]
MLFELADVIGQRFVKGFPLFAGTGCSGAGPHTSELFVPLTNVIERLAHRAMLLL